MWIDTFGFVSSKQHRIMSHIDFWLRSAERSFEKSVELTLKQDRTFIPTKLWTEWPLTASDGADLEITCSVFHVYLVQGVEKPQHSTQTGDQQPIPEAEALRGGGVAKLHWRSVHEVQTLSSKADWISLSLWFVRFYLLGVRMSSFPLETGAAWLFGRIQGCRRNE